MDLAFAGLEQHMVEITTLPASYLIALKSSADLQRKQSKTPTWKVDHASNSQLLRHQLRILDWMAATMPADELAAIDSETQTPGDWTIHTRRPVLVRLDTPPDVGQVLCRCKGQALYVVADVRKEEIWHPPGTKPLGRYLRMKCLQFKEKELKGHISSDGHVPKVIAAELLHRKLKDQPGQVPKPSRQFEYQRRAAARGMRRDARLRDMVKQGII